MFNKINPFMGLFGLEKENIRVNKRGELSKHEHNAIFGDNNPYITRDFSETQIEMITQPQSSLEAAYDQLTAIQHVVLSNIDDDYLWPQSNPPILPNDDKIELAKFIDPEKYQYRDYLSEKYGKKKGMISGIHLNLSFDDDYLKSKGNNDLSINLQEFKSNLYFKIGKYFLRDQWLYTKLFANSPVFHTSYLSTCVNKSVVNSKNDCQHEKLLSLRNSECGYSNLADLKLNFNSWNNYKMSISQLIEEDMIVGPGEIYSTIRFKEDKNRDIQYLELRFIDINPLFFNGVSLDALKFVHMMFIYYAQLPDFDYSEELQSKSVSNNMAVNALINDTSELDNGLNLKLEGNDILKQALNYFNTLEDVPYAFKEIFQSKLSKINDDSLSDCLILKNEILDKGFIDYHMDIAREYKNFSHAQKAELPGFESLELSTRILIHSAIKLGKIYEVLDQKSNLIQLESVERNRKEYVIQATKTSLDNYSSVLVMENKVVTKKVLRDHLLQTPLGISVKSIEEAMALYKSVAFPDQIVIKPNDTNFGLGISIFTNHHDEVSFSKAIKLAFDYSSEVIIETFVSGKEYRFLVIGGKVVSVLHRVPANVIGNGYSTIEELIEIKNKDVNRGENYRKPLEKIVIDSIMVDYLKTQDLSVETIIPEGVQVTLRENSNISTGGDSIEVSHKVDSSYIEIATKAALALNLNITGIDILIEDVQVSASQDNYSILEMNFNPAIHIHVFPYQGQGVEVGDLIISELFPQN